ncbi:MAG TPA: trypsin-like serine protease [Iamia sp.]
MIIAFVVMASATVTGVSAPPAEAIIGGSTSSRTWTVALINPDQSLPMSKRIECSGVLLSRYVVATSHHCRQAIRNAKVVIGRSNLSSSGGHVTTISKSKRHGGADIELIVLKTPAPASLTPISMFSSTQLKPGNDIHPYGYGRTGTDQTAGLSPTLRRTTLRVNKNIGSDFLATWDCRSIAGGDSGGPATRVVDGREYLVGVNRGYTVPHLGDPCRGGGYGSTFVRVTPGPDDQVYRWVKSNKNGW